MAAINAIVGDMAGILLQANDEVRHCFEAAV